MKIQQEDYENQSMGTYICTKVKNHIKPIPKIKDKSGTLKTYYKNKYADIIEEGVNNNDITWAMISSSPHAKKIIEEVYNFIAKQNKTSV